MKNSKRTAPAVMSYQERIDAQLKKHQQFVEQEIQWFRDNPGKTESQLGITFSGESKHRLMLEQIRALRDAGFEVESRGPEYDGMYRHILILTNYVKL